MLIDLPHSPGQSKRHHRKSNLDNSVICNDDDKEETSLKAAKT